MGCSPEVPEHERGGEDHGGRVGNVLAHDVLGDVSIENERGDSQRGKAPRQGRRRAATYRHPLRAQRRRTTGRSASARKKTRWEGDVQARRERTPGREEVEVSSGKGAEEVQRSRACTYSSQVASGHDSGSSDKGGSDVADDVAVQVRRHDDVELLGLGDELHRAGETKTRGQRRVQCQC